MPATPPLLPPEVLRRVWRLARFDGASVLGVAGLFALVSALLGDFGGALVGLVIAAAGAFEWHGASLLKGRHVRGMNWLVGSQLYLLVTVLTYIVWKMSPGGAESVLHFIRDVLKQPVFKSQLEILELTPDDLMGEVRTMYFFGMMAAAVGTFFYQGSMALYYHRRRRTVQAALAETSPRK